MKTTFLIAVYLVGIVYLIQWLMLAPFHVSNAFYLTLIRHPLHVVLTFNNLCRTSVSGENVDLLYDFPKFTCNFVFTYHYFCLLHVT